MPVPLLWGQIKKFFLLKKRMWTKAALDRLDQIPDLVHVEPHKQLGWQICYTVWGRKTRNWYCQILCIVKTRPQSLFEQVSQAIRIQAPNCNNTMRCLADNHMRLAITKQWGSTLTFSTLAGVGIIALQPPAKGAIPLLGRFTQCLASKQWWSSSGTSWTSSVLWWELFSPLFVALRQSSKLIHLAMQTQHRYTKYIPRGKGEGLFGQQDGLCTVCTS